MAKFSHWNQNGAVRMVDVTAKPPTVRKARAQAFVKMSPRVLAELPRNSKGNPLEIARIAGISAAKQTSTLIPLCHPLPLSHADVQVRVVPGGIAVESTVSTQASTGVEMEALTAASIAALTLYDMCKAIDKSIAITDICLLEKTGGKSGSYRAAGASPARGSPAVVRRGKR